MNIIVVLGCQTLDILYTRLDRAIELSEKLSDTIFIVSGGIINPTKVSEALIMTNYLISKGVPEGKIIQENMSTNTITNASFTKNLLEKWYSSFIFYGCEFDQLCVENGLTIPKHLEKIYIVTSEYHMPRTEYIFRKTFENSFLLEYLRFSPSTTPKTYIEACLDKEKKIMTAMKYT